MPSFKIIFLGAGHVNFGHPEGLVPWNHSIRIERSLADDLRVLAIIDPDIPKATEVLQRKLDDVIPGYESTQIFKDLQGYQGEEPDAVFIGVPPAFRGTTIKGRDVEIQVAKRFPRAGIFVEKPLSTAPAKDVVPVAEWFKEHGNFVAVGYMSRYLKIVQHVKKIIEAKRLVVASTNAWYQAAYSNETKDFYWDKSLSCGPIVEQATHLCDLSRYLAGEVDLTSINAVTVEHTTPAGHLSRPPVNESLVPPQNRIPRVTSAIWKYNSGGVGSLTHSILLHGQKYETQLLVIADGYSFRLVDLYTDPRLCLRSPENEDEIVYKWDDDPFLEQVQAFVEDVRIGKGRRRVLCEYTDAMRSYEFTWGIKIASERK